MGVSENVALVVLILNLYRLLDVVNFLKAYISSNTVLRTVLSCYVISRDFNQLCSVYAVSVICMNCGELRFNMLEYFTFRTSVS